MKCDNFYIITFSNFYILLIVSLNVSNFLV